jgi:hypothetical protein
MTQIMPREMSVLCQQAINPLNTKFLLQNIQMFISYLTGNTLRLGYKDQTVNAV